MQANRELDKKKYDAQLTEWEARISALKANSEKMAAQAKLDMKPKLEAIREKYEAAKLRVKEAASATEDNGEEGEKTVDHAWQELKAAVVGATDALKKHRPS